MKTKFLVLSVALLGFAALVSSNTMTAEPCTINVTVTYEGAPVSEALVGVSATADDREESVYIKELESNSAGRVTFTSLPAGTYYLDGYTTSPDGEDLWAEADVTVSAGSVDVALKLKAE